jgi:hypothetical protein
MGPDRHVSQRLLPEVNGGYLTPCALPFRKVDFCARTYDESPRILDAFAGIRSTEFDSVSSAAHKERRYN